MGVFVTYFDIAASIISMAFFAIAFYKSKNISARLQKRDVRAMLTDNIKEYELEIRAKIAGKFVINIGFLAISISRKRDGFAFINTQEMIFWFVIMLVWLVLVAFIDMRFAISKDYR